MKNARMIATLTVVLAAAGAKSAGQELEWSTGGDQDQGLLGASVVAIPDVNGDGRDDVVAGEPGAARLQFLSGRNGRSLYDAQFGAAADGFGSRVVLVDDADGDGVSDLVASAPGYTSTLPSQGALVLVSGADGSILTSVVGNASIGLLGRSLAAVADIDGDGLRDVIAGEFTAPAVEVRVFSGRDLSELLVLSGDAQSTRFGTAVAGMGDANGDGVDDLLVGDPFDSRAGREAGAVWLFSGADGSLIHRSVGVRDSQFGTQVLPSVDWNGDGLADYWVGAPIAGDELAGRVTLHSGRGGRPLAILDGEPGDWLGLVLRSAGDLTADGVEELAILSVAETRARILDGRSLRQLTWFTSESAKFALPTFEIAGIARLDRDATPDLVIGDPLASVGDKVLNGKVLGYTGTELFLWADERSMAIRTANQLHVRNGQPAARMLLYVEEFDGNPVFWRVYSNKLDAQGSLDLPPFFAPPSLQGVSVGFRAYSAKSGKIVASGLETIEIF